MAREVVYRKVISHSSNFEEVILCEVISSDLISSKGILSEVESNEVMNKLKTSCEQQLKKS